ncbi:PD40 domain-containing protein [Yeosuana aromativorans]|uniref:PD40 domain-containing protein n=1 Tax=Yeosuana aromativorans TaxID=288019 RepID=UPI001666FE66|nr:PD40 domain-containing protein [Yeosuana aromativorans]
MKLVLFVFVCCGLFGFSQQTTEPFLANIVKQFPNVRDTAISPNGNEILFSAQSVMGNTSAIITVTKNGNTWNPPQVASFSGQFFDIEPFFSTDGLTLYFASNRPLEPTGKTVKDFDIWYVKRSSMDDTWSEPINMGSPINTKNDEFYPCITNNRNLYFTMDNPQTNTKDDIYISEYRNGNYSPPKPLDDSINSNGYEFNAFIASDELFMVYTCYNREDGLGSGNLYISYKTDTGWSQVKNLGNSVNSDKMDYCPFIDTKSNTLYFTSKRDHSKTNFENPQSIEELLKEFDKYDNGSSRLYQVELGNFLKK